MRKIDLNTLEFSDIIHTNIKVDVIPINKDTRDREINGLVEAMEYFNIDHSYLITKDEDEELSIGEKVIYITPLYKFLLASNSGDGHD
jgi:hypothetical protein